MRCPYLQEKIDQDLGYKKYICLKTKADNLCEPNAILAAREPAPCLEFIGACPWNGIIIACTDNNCACC